VRICSHFNAGPAAGVKYVERLRAYYIVPDGPGRWAYYRLAHRVATIPKKIKKGRVLANYQQAGFSRPDSPEVIAEMENQSSGIKPMWEQIHDRP
jgi:hypothetical protein